MASILGKLFGVEGSGEYRLNPKNNEIEQYDHSLFTGGWKSTGAEIDNDGEIRLKGNRSGYRLNESGRLQHETDTVFGFGKEFLDSNERINPNTGEIESYHSGFFGGGWQSTGTKLID